MPAEMHTSFIIGMTMPFVTAISTQQQRSSSRAVCAVIEDTPNALTRTSTTSGLDESGS
jgi:hypothetical protein